ACGGSNNSGQTAKVSSAATSASGGAGRSALGEAQAPGAQPQSAGDSGLQTPGDTDTATDAGSTVGRMVVQSASLSVEVDDVKASLSQAQQLASSLGGVVQSSNTRQEGENLVADLTIAVPAERFTAALKALREMSKEVVSETVQGQDVTEEYVDLQSRARNLEATEKSLITLMGRATTVGDVLNVQRELTRVQGELEQLQGRMQYLKTKSDSSTITVSLRPVVAPATRSPEPAPGWSPAGVAARAWNASLAVLQAIATVAISVAVFVWWLVPVALVLFLVMRRLAHRRQAATAPGSSSSVAS
ncbi:MAG: DUF4349 domain-containing protein, partial [Chloroflexota bacterium]|nr:DUF4349 domain-containing protein [Chloroflexota bacterium]